MSIKDELYNYYIMMGNGFFANNTFTADGFTQNKTEYNNGNIPSGLVVNRQWRLLSQIHPDWRLNLSDDYLEPQIKSRLEYGELSPILFSDVDLAVIDRQAQAHIDVYVAQRMSLNVFGFVAQNYNELAMPGKPFARLWSTTSTQDNIQLGKLLFYRALREIDRDRSRLVPVEYNDDLNKLLLKDPTELTEYDYVQAMKHITDSFYALVVNPISQFIHNELHDSNHRDIQSGQDRMTIIYRIIAAVSSSFSPQEKLRHEHFGAIDARNSFYNGVEAFFSTVQDAGIDRVAVSRGNQFPLTQTPLGSIFSRIHTTLLATKRSSEDLDPLHPRKKIYASSQLLDNMSTLDKVRVMFHETLMMFDNSGIKFSSPQELFNGVATYLDHCLFISDSDLEAWGTCPFMLVLSLHSPTERDVKGLYNGYSKHVEPLVVLNPLGRDVISHGYSPDRVVADFDPGRSTISKVLDKFSARSNMRISL